MTLAGFLGCGDRCCHRHRSEEVSSESGGVCRWHLTISLNPGIRTISHTAFSSTHWHGFLGWVINTNTNFHWLNQQQEQGFPTNHAIKGPKCNVKPEKVAQIKLCLPLVLVGRWSQLHTLVKRPLCVYGAQQGHTHLSVHHLHQRFLGSLSVKTWVFWNLTLGSSRIFTIPECYVTKQWGDYKVCCKVQNVGWCVLCNGRDWEA